MNHFLSWGGRNTLSLFQIHVTCLAIIFLIETKLGLQMPCLWLLNLVILCTLTVVIAKLVEKYSPFMIGKSIKNKDSQLFVLKGLKAII